MQESSTHQSRRWFIAITTALVLLFIGAAVASSKPLRKYARRYQAADCQTQSRTTEYNDLYVMTIATSQEFAALEQLVASIQKVDRFVRIAVFDNGLSKAQHDIVGTWLNVAIFAFGKERYPMHVGFSSTGAARFLAFHDAVRLLGSVVYVEPGYVVRSLAEIRHQLKQTGSYFALCDDCPSKLEDILTKTAARKLGVNVEEIRDLPVVDAHVFAMSTGSVPTSGGAEESDDVTAVEDINIVETVLVPLAECALDRACIADKRGDAAALTALIAENYDMSLASLQGVQRSKGLSDLRPITRCSPTPWPLPTGGLPIVDEEEHIHR